MVRVPRGCTLKRRLARFLPASGHMRITPLVILAGAALAACAPPQRETVTLSADTLEVREGARRLAVIPGFRQPESILYDAHEDVYFVSAMAGAGSVKNNSGYIVRFAAADLRRREVLVAGGDGVTLHAPKGMAVTGDTLWVADIDVIRGFHRRTGARLAEHDLRPWGVRLLNDIEPGPDGTLYVSDSGIIMSDAGVLYPRGDRVFAIAPDGAVRVIASGEQLSLPNGLRWDANGDRLIVASFHPFTSEVYALGLDGTRTVLGKGPGRFDGLQLLEDGRIVATSWEDHSIHVFDGSDHYRIITHLDQAAGIGVDTRRNRLLIPLVRPGTVEVWQLH